MKTSKTERRIDGKARLVKIASILCALFAAAGVAHGLHEANPDGGWLIPIFAGIVAAAALAIFWHVVIGMVVGMVRLPSIICLFVVSTIVTVVALGASAQAIATAIAGRSALSAELSAQVDGYNQKLGDAYTEATRFSSVASAAGAKGTGYEKQAETEAGGGNATGKGCGPKCSSLKDIASSFFAGKTALDAMLAEAAEERDAGEQAMVMLRDAAARGDQQAFMTGAEGVSQAIAAMNAIDPRPIINNIGAVVVSDKGIDLTRDTQEFYATAEKALAERVAIDSPVFVPMSLGEATRKQVLGSALHGWILAGAIDVLPLLFLILTFAASREVWLNEDIERAAPTHEEKDDADRERLRSMMGGKPRLVAAE